MDNYAPRYITNWRDVLTETFLTENNLLAFCWIACHAIAAGPAKKLIHQVSATLAVSPKKGR